MKMAGGASTPCIRTDLVDSSSTKSDGMCESKQPHGGTLFGAATCPVQKDVMKASPSMQTAVEAGAWTGENASTTG